MTKPLLTMKIDVLEVEAVMSFIERINLKELDNKELFELDEALSEKRREVTRKFYERGLLNKKS